MDDVIVRLYSAGGMLAEGVPDGSVAREEGTATFTGWVEVRAEVANSLFLGSPFLLETRSGLIIRAAVKQIRDLPDPDNMVVTFASVEPPLSPSALPKSGRPASPAAGGGPRGPGTPG